jgi:hypothetical protein
MENRDACGIIVGNPEGKRPLGRPRHRFVYTFEVDLKQTVMNWIALACGSYWPRAVVNTVMNLFVL